MTAVMSPSNSPSPSPQHQQFSPKPTSSPSVPALNTSYLPRRSPLQRPPSYAKNRMSTYSTTSRHSEPRSRPVSHAFPAFHSSLPYTLVRDFAYPVTHPWHYGPPPEPSEPPSGATTPASERQRRLSDPPNGTWESSTPQWAAGVWGDEGSLVNQQLPQMAYGDGPPYSEDEDLHSPVVASRHKKYKPPLSGPGSRQGKGKAGNPGEFEDGEAEYGDQADGQRSYFAGADVDGMETYYIGEEDDSANGPGGELVTYSPDQARSMLAPTAFGDSQRQRDSHFARLPNRSFDAGTTDGSHDNTGSGFLDQDDSRYSRDYQFTIASPDEEMHGKAVALFDFARENENELPLVEGQIIWVSYRHGQGWLVAEDPKTGDAGLVPEEYVRLLRDIEGGWSSLSGEESPSAGAPLEPDESAEAKSLTHPVSDTASTPTQTTSGNVHSAQPSNGSNNGKSEKRPPIVSTFSTSSRDLDPYPHNLRNTQAGATPPAVIHQTSNQTGTPIASPPPTSTIASDVSGETGSAPNQPSPSGPEDSTEDSPSEDVKR